MKLLNFGSINIDCVYGVDTFVQPGETKQARAYREHCGGKGLNQSIAAARAGLTVSHAAFFGADGRALVDMLRDSGVDVSAMMGMDGASGRAIIQVDDAGQNCILLYGGTNRSLTTSYIDRVLDAFGTDVVVLLQNEMNLSDYIISAAAERGLRVVLNAAPMDATMLRCPIDKVTCLIVNEIEGRQLARCEEETAILPTLRQAHPNLSILLTLGARGAVFDTPERTYTIGAYKVPVVDTTAAGDTFVGYFLRGMLLGDSFEAALRLATSASAVCIQQEGASASIPNLDQVEAFLRSMGDKTPECTVICR
mgnify:CR=1 FL=1